MKGSQAAQIVQAARRARGSGYSALGSFWGIQFYGVLAVTFLSFFPALIHTEEYLFLALLVSLLGKSFVERSFPDVRSPIDVPLAIFVLWVLCTVPFATDSAYSFSEWRKFVTHALAFYWAGAVFRHQPVAQLQPFILGTVVTGGFCLALYATSDFFLAGGLWRYNRAVRAGAPSSDYNWLTTYLVLVLPLFISACFIYRQWWLRLSMAIAIVLGLMAQAASYTRAGWLAHGAQAFGFLLVRGRHRALIAVVGASVIVGALFMASALKGRSNETLDPWTLEARVAVWKLGWADIQEHPFVGVGYGNDTFLKRHRQYATDAQLFMDERARVLPSMHNAFLMVGLGSGLPAFVAFVWMFVAIMWGLMGINTRELFSAQAVMAFAVGVAVLGFAVRNCFDYMFAGSLAYLFWILVAYGLALREAHRLGRTVPVEVSPLEYTAPSSRRVLS